MKIIIKGHGVRTARSSSVLRWSGYILFFIGILALGWVGFVLLDARLYQADQAWRFQRALKSLEPSTGSGAPESLHPPLTPSFAEANAPRGESLRSAGLRGSPLGRIEIGAIGLAAMILEGADEGTLRRAVGHLPNTPLPGQQGNVVMTGHRDTFFRPLRDIRKGDEITLTTLNGSYRYRVGSTEVVEPDDMEVLVDSDHAVLTLITCYPFYFVGPAPKRFIVRADMIY